MRMLGRSLASHLIWFCCCGLGVSGRVQPLNNPWNLEESSMGINMLSCSLNIKFLNMDMEKPLKFEG